MQARHRRNSIEVSASQKQRLDKGIGVKRLEVVQGFANADEFDRQVHRLAHGDNNASFRRAVELGQDHAGTADAFGENLGLANRVLAVGGVDDEQDFMGCPGNEPLDDVTNLLELAHQVSLSMKPSRGVDDQDVDMAGQCPLAGVVGHAGRISPRRPFDDLAAGPIGPDRELISRRGAKGIASSQQDRISLIFEMLSKLGDRGGLARAVDSGDQVDSRRLGSDAKRPWPEGPPAAL